MVWVWIIVILLMVRSPGFDEQNGDAAGVSVDLGHGRSVTSSGVAG